MIESELALLARRIEHVRRSVRLPDGTALDRSAYLLLDRIDLAGSPTLAELGTLLQLDQSTVHRQVAALEAAGDVERVPDPGGARAARLRLTAGGRSRLATTRAGRADRIGRILAGWSPEDRATLGTLLTRLNADLVHLTRSATGADH